MALTQVTSIGLKDGEIVNADLHSAASVALSKLASTGALGSAITATTQSASDDSTKLATTAFVQAAVTSLIDGAPGSLNTLNELAAAINDDSSYATTLTTALATKAVLSGSTNNTIATVTGANALIGESELTYTGGLLKVAAGYPTFYLDDTTTTNNRFRLTHNNELTQLEADPNNVYSNSRIQFDIDGSERLRITSSAATLKGTTDGVLNLDTTDSRGSFIRFQQGGTTKVWVGCGQGLNAGGVNDLGLQATTNIVMKANGGERVRITAGGVVSIGGRVPSISANVGLEISGHATTEIRLKNTAGGTGSGDGLAIQKWSNGNSYFWEYDAQDILFGTNGIARLLITSTGRIRLGDPSGTTVTDLDVVRANSTITDVMLVKGNAGNGFIRFQDNDVSCNWTMGVDDGSGVGANGFIWYDRINAAYRLSLDNDGDLRVWSGKLGVGVDPTEKLHVQQNHNSHTKAVIQNNYGANATAQLNLISPTDELAIVKYASGAAALNLSNNSTIITNIGGATRVQLRGDSTGQTTHIVNTPSPGGNGVASQYVTQPHGMSGNYTNFRVTVTQSSWGSFFLKLYVSGYSGDTAHRWVTGYINNGLAGTRTVLSNDSGDFGSGSITHISGQSWRYDLSVNSGSVTHPVMLVELAVAGNGNVLGNGAVVCAIT